MVKVKTIILQAFFLLFIQKKNLCSVFGLAEESSPEKSIFHVDTEMKSFRVANIRYDAKTGVPITIYNVGYVANGHSPQDLADDFLRNNQHLLNTQSASEMESWQITSTRKTGIWTTVRYRQMFDNVPVYNADIAITINEQNIVRVVSSKYKKGVYLELDQITPKQTKSDIINKAVQKYGKGNIDNLKYASAEMVIYHAEKGKSKLAWKVDFSINDDLSEMEAVYEDKTGNILLEVDRTLDKRGGRDKSKMHQTVGVTKDNESKKKLKGKRKVGRKFLSVSLDTVRRNEKSNSRSLYSKILGDLNFIIQNIFVFIKDLFGWPRPSSSSITPQPISLPTPSLPFLHIPTSSPLIITNSPSTASPIAPREGAVGYVFDPDPLSSAKAGYNCKTGFCDNNDSNSPQLNMQLTEVVLQNLTSVNDTYFLKGPFAEIIDIAEPFDGIFEQTSDDFLFKRSQPAFEAVNSYYHIDQIMRYINHDLKIPVMPFHYRGGVKCDPHASNGQDNSYYSMINGVLHFGQGGVDDAEDADVIVHELGHAIHDWITDGSLSQVDGLSEGFGDYLAASYSRSKGLRKPEDPEYNWVFKWDGHNEFWPGRVLNYGGHYPEDIKFNVHTDGQMWSSSNMEIWDRIGRHKSDKIHLLGLSTTNSESNQEDAANAVYLAAMDLGYSEEEKFAIRQIFRSRGYYLHDGSCGDGILGDLEECDGDLLRNSTCADSGCSGGIPTCSLDCKLDYTSCTAGKFEMKVQLELTFDSYPEETAWAIYDDTNIMVQSGGFDVEYDDLKKKNITEGMCLNDSQCYKFELYDSYYDGICCEYGDGGYNILVNDILVVHEDKARFETKAVHFLGTNCEA